MARNAKLDLAKRQAVGIDRPVARFAPDAVGSFRNLEGTKACYLVGKPDMAEVRALVAAYDGVVTVCPVAVAHGSQRPARGGFVADRSFIKPGISQPGQQSCVVQSYVSELIRG